MTMRVLVTGAAGFLGSHLTDRLLGEGHSVLGVDNLSTGDLENLAHLAGEPRFRFEERDICRALRSRAGGLRLQLGLAGQPAGVSAPGDRDAARGLGGRGEHAGDCRAQQGAGYLHASTSECYGDPLEHPQAESYWGNVNPVGPRSVYDEAKRFAEALVMAYHRSRGVNTHLVRIFNTYGPRLHPGDGRVISNFMMQALRGEPLTIYGDGNQTRSFCYVDDLIEGVLRLSRSDEHLPVNIGNPDEFTILECAQAVLEVTGAKSQLCFVDLPVDDPTRRRPDITKARTLLEWEPRVSLKEGLAKSLEFFRSHAEPRDAVVDAG